MKRLLQIASYILVAALASCITLMVFAGGREYSKLDELQSVIDRYFIEEPDMGAVEDAAASAMVEALGDRWSYYMTAEEYLNYQDTMANSYVGVGITIQQREDGYIDIVRVEAGGPAEEAGVLPGDVMTAVAGQDISAMDVDEIKSLVQGEAGTSVRITVERDGSPLDITVQRRLIQSVVATGEMLEGNVGLVTIVNFDSRCTEETVAAIEALLEQGAQALIFDVRYNPGGYKHELVNLLDYLLPEGPLFRSVDYAGNEAVDMSDADCLDIPMMVLMNGDSYSAAEFFAAALSEYGAAKLVGEPTTGKGYFQSTYGLRDGSAVNISVGKYTTPNGVTLADVGLTPDILVDVDDELYMEIYYGNVSAREDPQIRAALEALLDP